MSFNKVILVGNLTRAPELKYTQGKGTPVAKTGIAVSRKANVNGEMREEVCFIDLTFWGRTAEVANQYLQKGSKVLIEGRLMLEQWQDQNGQNRSKHSVTVESMEMLGSKESSSNNGYNGGGYDNGYNDGGYANQNYGNQNYGNQNYASQNHSNQSYNGSNANYNAGNANYGSFDGGYQNPSQSANNFGGNVNQGFNQGANGANNANFARQQRAPQQEEKLPEIDLDKEDEIPF